MHRATQTPNRHHRKPSGLGLSETKERREVKLLSQIAGSEASILGDAGHHLGADFFAIMKSEHDIRPAIS